MARLPLLSGRVLVKILSQIGYQIARQRGSHIRLENLLDKNKRAITIPNHKEIGRGLLRKILRDAEIGWDEFENLL
ncbi:MAG: type II toxin-antitoxin system HicA family toxin [Candidatus Magasanikbacteria bacterium]|jgi:predicted RNA binding protein YcfA (HicA-like mRNA interferase family)